MAYTTINKSTDYFNTKLYTGNGSDNNAITGVGFQPDMVWLKNRSTTDSHYLQDAVRTATKNLKVDATDAEETRANSLKSFNSDGFTLGTETAINGNGNDIASWNWKANGAGSSNTDGSITSTVSANTTAGFSIVKWTASSNGTIGHGLGEKPAMVIVKSTDNTAPWLVWHKGLSGGSEEDRYIVLNTTTAEATYTDYWGTGGFTSSVFGVNADNLNNNLGTMVAYCFAEKTGYSKFGSYTGNGNADGTFVYTGFKPSLVIIKSSSYNGSNWHMYDTKRNTFNVMDYVLKPDDTTAEITPTNTDIDCLSNGFKLRGTDVATNESGGSLIYMAFGQSLVGSNNTPCTAR